jgi:23S rRNA (uracil1939-C5)-methyltransferase
MSSDSTSGSTSDPTSEASHSKEAPRIEEIEIRGLAAGGDGVGRSADGRVVFVPFSAPGDRLRVRLVDERKRFAHGEIERILEASPWRTAPLCGVYGDCGGCTWQHVAYDVQLRAKTEILTDALERVGHLALPGPVEVTPSPTPYRYRSRTRVLAKAGRVGYRRRGSHDLCATSRCPVLVPTLDAALSELAAQHPEPAEEWELVAGEERTTRTTALRRPLPAEPRLTLRVLGDRMSFSPGVFIQGNALLSDALAEAVHAAAGGGELGIELFCGAGFFSLGLARRFARLVAVESEGRAVADLRRNVEVAELANVEVVRGLAEEVLERFPGADCVVVDPPRTGLPPGCIEALTAAAPRRLVYVSCDAATLARDLARLVKGGYALSAVRGFDLFPQTPHVEAVATMEREPTD